MILPRTDSAFSSGVLAASVCARMPAIWPISVSLPVPTTTAAALPRTTKEEEYSIHRRSASGALSGTGASDLETPLDSPVSADSSQRSSSARRMRQSAGIMSPSSNTIRSPGTSARLSKSRSLPPRTALTRQTERRSQLFDGGVRAVLLDEPDDGVEQHDEQKDARIGQPARVLRPKSDDGGEGGGAEQEDGHEVLELRQEQAERPALFAGRESVFAQPLQAGLRLRLGEPDGRTLQRGECVRRP